MIYPTISSENPWLSITPKVSNPPLMKSPSFHFKPTLCFHHQDLNTINKPVKPRTYFKNATLLTEAQVFYGKSKRSRVCEERGGFPHVGSREMSFVCGFGYWVQGFRCFPWLALNFHMAHSLSLHPSTLQLVQNSGNLPMVAKPLYGILSDALYIGGAHRIPYVSIGVILQILSWGPLALIPVTGQSLTTLMACVLLSNFGASITEVAKDALVAEYGQQHQINGLQSYALMASAAGGILGNLFGGCFLMKTSPRTMFLMFSILLSFQLANSLTTREESLGLFQPSDDNLMRSSVKESTRKKLSDLMVAIREEKNIYHPLTWILASILMVPSLSGSIFCYQTHCLHLDPSVIGMSRVIGQLLLLTTTVLYDRHWRKVPIRSLASAVQILYAGSLLLDLVLVKQINVKLGIPTEVFALCFSGLSEIVAQFKILPFSVLFASLCPQGCEGSLTSFLASILCFSSIVSGLLGVGLASSIGIMSGDYSRLPVGIVVQFLTALVPLLWIYHLPTSQGISEKERKKGMSKRTRRNRRVGRVAFGSVNVYRRERESEMQS